MKCSRAKPSKTSLTVAAVVAAAAMAVCQWGFAQAPPGWPTPPAPPSLTSETGTATCPSTGCDIPGLTVPNGLTMCTAGPNTTLWPGTDVHDSTVFNRATQLCNYQALVPSGNGLAGTAINQSGIAPATWVYGPDQDLTAAQLAAPFWNPVQTSMAAGLPIYGTRVSTGTGYCSVAAYVAQKNDFTWVDERFSPLENSETWAFWANNAAVNGIGQPAPCALTNTMGIAGGVAARGVEGSSLDEREAQHDADGGAILFIRPVQSVRDAQEAIFWNFYPPFGHRSQGNTNGGGATSAPSAAGSYRDSFDRNAVVFAEIYNVAGAQAASGIAALDGIDGVYLDAENLAFQSGGGWFYERLVSAVTAAVQANSKYLCTANRAVTPNTMTCTLQTKLGAADIPNREWPLRRLDANGKPYVAKTFAANANAANREE